jgi:5-methylcytosine-specific restriction endonuclease McrA
MQSKKRTGIKLEKTKCEVCSYAVPAALHIHHIIPQCDERCSNNLNNLAVLCAICHNLVHTGDITIIGVYSSTKGRQLMYFKKGEQPPLEEKYWKIHPRDNPLVLRK